MKKAPTRLTLYVKPQHQALLRWAQEHTRAASLSEAVFSALAELQALLKKRQLQALEATHGIWKDDPRIQEAFQELEAEWKAWRERIEGS